MIFDIKRFAVHDGPGIRTTVFLKGCPLSCSWCHNPESISSKPFSYIKNVELDGEIFEQEETIGYEVMVDTLFNEIRKDLLVMEESGGGVTFSGGEPLLQADYLSDLLSACQNVEIHTAVDTSGYAKKEALGRIMPFTDLFLFDIKMMDPQKHKFHTGVSNELILSNLMYILACKKSTHIRLPLINGINTDIKNITDTLKFLASFPDSIEQIDLLPYHKIGKHKYQQFGMEYNLSGNEEVSREEVLAIKEKFENVGFKVNVGG